MISSSKIDLVLFGARGDLSRRKLFPALYQLDKADLLSDDTRIAAVARQAVSYTHLTLPTKRIV